MYRAVASVLGANSSTEDMPSPREFVPHVSVAYVSADGEAQPITQALQTAVTAPVSATFRKAALLEFHRDQLMYEWTSATPIAIGSAPT
jgi:2'-5' RNA ligase